MIPSLLSLTASSLQDSSSTVEASTSQAGEAAEEGMVTPGQSPDTSWLPAGMDPDSSYLLKIRLTSNPKKSRKDFSCFKITKVVDSDLCNFKDFVEEIVDQYKGLNLDDLMDKIRQLIMNKWDVRRIISQNFKGVILPHIMKELKEQSRNLDMDVQRSGDAVAEVSVKGGSGYKCVVKLDARTCSCKKWELTGIPCKHAIAFITSLREPLEKYVDMRYSTQKFRVAYETLIPAMPDKNQWSESNHGFFMHPPLLKSTAGRRHNERFKGCMEAGGSTTKRKGSHKCPICKNYGHRWYNCKNGDPEDIAAMLAESLHAMQGSTKEERSKKSEPSCESAILPVDSVPKAMHFPPSQRASTSMDSNSLRSAHGSNQPELLSIEYPVLSLGQTTPPSATSIPTKEKKKATGKGKGKAAGKGKGKAKEQGKKKKKIPVLPDSPAMSTRSKTPQRQSPAAHTRSKRKLPDLNL
ncbi:hypothetical protein U9M48_027013 [Paspalum notatum var. saurae]|uniref:SWIM-type domain-containing protein n=1 Tax=Paspalum notatum var. saurae TaxID=547442 RepID=A0AAQ3TVP2_PASNO